MKNMELAVEENCVDEHPIAETNGQIDDKFNHLDVAYRNSETKDAESENGVSEKIVNGSNGTPVLKTNCMLFIEDDVLKEKLNGDKVKDEVENSTNVENETEKSVVPSLDNEISENNDLAENNITNKEENIIELCEKTDSKENTEDIESIERNNVVSEIEQKATSEDVEMKDCSTADENVTSKEDELKECNPVNETTELNSTTNEAQLEENNIIDKTVEPDVTTKEAELENELVNKTVESEATVGEIKKEFNLLSEKSDVTMEETQKECDIPNKTSDDITIEEIKKACNYIDEKCNNVTMKESQKESSILDEKSVSKENSQENSKPPQSEDSSKTAIISLPEDDDDDDDIVLVETESNQSISQEKQPETVNTEVSQTIETDAKTSVPEIIEPEKVKEKEFVLQPLQFMSFFKEHFENMTRDNLEEFCLIKFAEAIDSKCDLSKALMEIQKLNNNLEEWRKKVVALTKQNKDLQIVIKTMAEQLKKPNNENPQPIKITRSVGLQVGVPCVNKKASSTSSSSSETAPNKNKAKKVNQIAKKQTEPTNPSTSKVYTPVNKSTPQMIRPAEKRQSQQTIDLTDDDERPAKQAKVVAKQTPPVSNKGQPKQYSNIRSTPKALLPPVGPKQVFVAIPNQNKPTYPTNTLMIPKNTPGHQMIQIGPRGKVSKILPSPTSSHIRIAPKNTAHPASLPSLPRIQPFQDGWKQIPPRPSLKIMKVDNGIVISWEMEDFRSTIHEEVASYQIYAYQQTISLPSTDLWKKIGEVKALPLPMACTLTHFMAGYKYFFAIRALDVKTRVGAFSKPEEISLI